MGLCQNKNITKVSEPWFYRYFHTRVEERIAKSLKTDWPKVSQLDIDLARRNFPDSSKWQSSFESTYLLPLARDLCIRNAVILANAIAEADSIKYLAEVEVADCYLASIMGFGVGIDLDEFSNLIVEELVGSFTSDLDKLLALDEPTVDDITESGVDLYVTTLDSPDAVLIPTCHGILFNVLRIRKSGDQRPYYNFERELTFNLKYTAIFEIIYENEIEPSCKQWMGIINKVKQHADKQNVFWWDDIFFD